MNAKPKKRVKRPVTPVYARGASPEDLARWNSMDKSISNSQQINHQQSYVNRSVTKEAARVASPDNLKLCNSMDNSIPNSQQINHQLSLEEATIYISQSNTCKQYDVGTFQAVNAVTHQKY